MLNIDDLLVKAKEKINATQQIEQLDQLKVEYLGKKGVITLQLKQMGVIAPEKRKDFGQAINFAKKELESLISTAKASLQEAALYKDLKSQSIDVTLSGRGSQPGGKHILTAVTQQIVEFFTRIGFIVAEGPEIEDQFHNFSALNTPEHHPARDMHDTFYFEDGTLLRSHTSPVQIRAMCDSEPPFRLIAPGRVYRRDSDLTHTPMFHQVEGLVVDKKTSFAQLKAVLTEFLNYFFETNSSVRFRPSFFPFTEPSAEVDIQCVNCGGKGCRICSHTGWLEILGCGMVHPNVLANCNVNTKDYLGYAFGMGVERLAMLKYKITDLRMFFENDMRFLQQFN